MFVVIQENASEKLVSASKSFSHVGILYQVADIVEFETIIQCIVSGSVESCCLLSMFTYLNTVHKVIVF